MNELRVTACNRDCPDACTLCVELEGERAVKLRGGSDDPVTRGFLCERTSRFLSRQYSADRLLYPSYRGRRVSWETALDLAAEHLLRCRRESGAASVLHYRSGGSLGLLKHLADYLFEQFGPVTIKRGDICSGAGETAQQRDFGHCDASDTDDLVNSRLIVVWGRNIHTSWTHLLPVLTEARRQGAVVVGIDPVRTRTARLCDLFLTPRPGSDYSLAMGLVRFLFEQDLTDPQAGSYCDNLEVFRELSFEHTFQEWAEQADVDSDELQRLGQLYATHRPATILVGWGLARRGNGSATVRALDGLAAVSGNLGLPGAGVSYYFQRRAAFDLEFVKGLEAAPRSLAEAALGREILAAQAPPIRAVWITAANPVSMLPDAASVRAALEQTELVVAVDTHPTDTTECADLVLPTLTLLEDDDLLGAYGNHYLRESRPALSPPGEARHELRILQDLAQRLGLGPLLEGTPEQWKRRLMRRLSGAGVTLERLRQGPVRNPFAPRVAYEGRRFTTPSGRVNLMTRPAGKPALPAEDYPLTLMAVSTPKAQSSQWSVEVGPVPQARVHPDCGLVDGARARLESRLGGFEVSIKTDAGVRPELVVLPKGGMQRMGWCANALVAAEETDDGGGAAYYDQPVRLVPLGRSAERVQTGTRGAPLSSSGAFDGA